MACAGKKKYMTAETARMVLGYIKERTKKKHSARKEKRYYKCPICGFWHLTKYDGSARGRK